MTTEEQIVDSYLSFRLGHESFAVRVSKVIEILEVPHITKVPKSPTFMRGVINLRGTVLPVVDTRLKFSMKEAADSVNTCIVVFSINFELEVMMVGALVDEVQEVFEMDEGTLMPPPSIGGKYKTEFIRGMTKKNEDFLMVLEVDKIFSNDEIINIQSNTEEKTSI